MNKVKNINAARPKPGWPIQELTLAELQAIQFTDAPAPTGITITPDAVGSNPVTWYYRFAVGLNGDDKVSPLSEEVSVILGDDTSVLIVNFNCQYTGSIYIFKGSISGQYSDFSADLLNPFDLPFNVLAETFISIENEVYSSKEKIKIPNSLPIGQQYYVTDKNWLLYVDSPTVLKPVKGSLHIFNGETLPEGIEPDVLFIDTGVIENDIPVINPLIITVPNNYLLIGGYGKVLGSIEPYTLEISQRATSIIINPGDFVQNDIINFIASTWTKMGMSDPAGFNCNVSLTDNGSGGVRFLLKFQRLEFPFPI